MIPKDLVPQGVGKSFGIMNWTESSLNWASIRWQTRLV
jgi:hypothetical protein